VTLGAIVQVRLSSERLPGKVLADVGGRPMLAYLLERLERVPGLDAVIVATSDHPTDDPVVDFCQGRGAAWHRGSLRDVSDRFRSVLDRFGLDAFVRVSGDSPLLDPQLVSRAIGMLAAEDAEVVTNVLPRTYPPGQSVEVVRSVAYRRALRLIDSDQDREHVTRCIYRHPDRFKLVSFQAERPYAGVHLAVAEHRDLERLRAAVARMRRPQWEYGLEEVVSLYASAEPGREPARE